MKTRKRNNKKIRKTKHKKKRKTMRIKVIKKKYNKTRKMKGGQTSSDEQKRRKKNRQRTLTARTQAKENKKKIIILNKEITKLENLLKAKNAILTIIKRQRERKIKEIDKLNNEIDKIKIQLNNSKNKEKFCQKLIGKIQKLKIIRGDETTELANAMRQIMDKGEIFIPHEINKKDQKDVWKKLDFGEQSLKSTPNERTISARDKSIKKDAIITSMSDLISLRPNEKTTKEEFDLIAELNKQLKDAESIRNRREESEKKRFEKIQKQLDNFVKERRKQRSAAPPAPAAPAPAAPAISQ